MADDDEVILLTQDEINTVSQDCDIWHVHGNAAIHKRDDIDDFVEELKTKLPKVELPVKIGCTGYPILLKGPTPKSGWCLDAANRFTAIANGNLMFRRYTAGGPIMCGRLGEPCSDMMDAETRTQLLSTL